MARQVEKFYNAFGGIDTRSNKLVQNPKFARRGRNFQYNFQDELCKRNGFQHKIPGPGCEAALMEYKFRDINTGEAKTEILGIGSDGNLNRLDKRIFRITKSGGVVDSYSLFYDDTGTPTWRIVFYSALGSVVHDIPFDESENLSGLATYINGLAITGIVCTTHRADGVPAGSTLKAYLLDTVIREKVKVGSTDNEAWAWDPVPKPSSGPVFPMVVSQSANPDYEGPTWENLNNCIYITDGGFPMKYDGRAVYRAGAPKTFPIAFGIFGPTVPGAPTVPAPALATDRQYSGFSFSNIATPVGGFNLAVGTYRYKVRFGFRDANGAITYGGFYNDTHAGQAVISANQCGAVTIPYLKNGAGFGVFSARLNGLQNWGTGAGPYTVTVDSGHNVLPGMCLMVPSYLGSSTTAPLSSELYTGRGYFYAKVSSTTSTTITVEKGPFGRPGDGIFSYTPDNTVINAYWVPEEQENQFGIDAHTGNKERPFGFFCELFRTKVGVFDTYYFDCAVPMPRISGEEYSFYDMAADANIIEQLDETLGSDLPRACRYLAKWQETLIQAGRPYDSFVRDQIYPSFYLDTYPDPSYPGGVGPIPLNVRSYTEAGICDFQSVFWASQEAPEGFPQDGLHEFLIETKFNDEIRGIIGNKDSFFAFKERSTGYLTGSLFAENDVALEIMEADVGTACHKVLQEVQGAIMFMDPRGGYWSIVAGRLPVFIGYAIEDQFRLNKFQRKMNLRKAVATNFLFDDKYVCYLPGETSGFFVFDYASVPSGNRAAWYMWDGVSGAGGVLATANDELLLSGGSEQLLWKQKFTGTEYDLSDHKAPVAWEMVSSFINFGAPVIDKTFKKVWVNSIQGGFNILLKQYANYTDEVVEEFEITMLPPSPGRKTVKNYCNVVVDKLSAMSIGFENAAIYADVRIQGWELEFAPVFDSKEARA